ncbi:hypothetical protein ACFFRR_004580 [Megaselia abdita]
MSSRIVIVLLVFELFMGEAVAFNGKGFIQTKCQVRNAESLIICSNFTLTIGDIYEIQTVDFNISSHQSIEFKNCNVGIVNENFFSKFPEALSMSFENCKILLSSSILPVTPRLSKLINLSFHKSTIKDHLETNALKSLPELKTLYLNTIQLREKILDRYFLMNLSKLEQLSCYQCGFDRIQRGALDDLTNLTHFSYYNTNISYVHRNMFKRNKNLKTVEFYGNKLKRIPYNFFPKSVKTLMIEKNPIALLKEFQFKKLHFLETLFLDNNDIGNVHKRAFDGLKNLRTLSLSENNIKVLSKRHFKALVRLDSLRLRGNPLGTFTDKDWYKDLRVNNVNVSEE